MIFSNWKIKIKDVGYKLTRDLYIFRQTPQGTEILQPNGLNKVISHDSAFDEEIKPMLELSPEMLQELAEELSNNGYKPLKGFMEGKLEATEKHLEDMRKIVFEPIVNGKTL